MEHSFTSIMDYMIQRILEPTYARGFYSQFERRLARLLEEMQREWGHVEYPEFQQYRLELALWGEFCM
jgi:hypothetical protein